MVVAAATFKINYRMSEEAVALSQHMISPEKHRRTVREAYIMTLGVDERYRHRGLGKELLQVC
jgi:ribosomal protein S18 acetylase RimI-like enzyme